MSAVKPIALWPCITLPRCTELAARRLEIVTGAILSLCLLLSRSVTCQDEESWRLVSKNERTSSALTAGRLELFHNGSWGTFCSDGFSSTDASVSCWLLTGYAEVLAYGTVGSLEIGFDPGPKSSPIWVTNFHCSDAYNNCLRGNTLNYPTYARCSVAYSHCIVRSGFGNTANCPHSKDIAISCHAGNALRLSYEADLPKSSPGSAVGRLEIYHEGEWGTIEDYGFDQTAADVVCQQLGYDRAYKYGNIIDVGYNHGSGIIWLSNVQCMSTDVSLANCQHTEFGVTNERNHSRDVAIECLPQLMLRLVTKREKTTPYLLAGRVEVLYNGQWGTICSDGFDNTDASVLCQKLTGSPGVLRYGEVGSYGLEFDQGSSSSPVLQCTTAGYQCYHNGFGNTKCTHEKDIAVSCLAAGSLRLVNKSHPIYTSVIGDISGRLEIYIKDSKLGYMFRSIEVCDFDQTTADVVCRQLGYERAYNYGDVEKLGFSRRNGSIAGNFRCSTSDLLLVNCTSDWSAWSACNSHDRYQIAVSCDGPGPTLSGVQVFGIVLINFLFIVCCAVGLTVCVLFYRKYACTTRVPTNRLHEIATITPPASSRTRTNFHHAADPDAFIHAQMNETLSPLQHPMQSAGVEKDSPHLEAATHTGEAPPAYHTAALYQTVPPGTVTQFEDSIHKDSSSEAPPAYYTDIAGRDAVCPKV